MSDVRGIGRLSLYSDIWDKIGAPEAVADTRMMCRNRWPKSAGYWGMEADFVSFLARSRCSRR